MQSSAKPTWHDVSDRYHGQLAPPGLHLIQALANSTARTSSDADPLGGDLDTAQEWIDVIVAEWSNAHGGEAPEITVTADSLARIKKLRATVRAVLLRDPKVKLVAPVVVTASGDSVTMAAQGAGARWLESAASAELLTAAQAGTLRRLKLCRNPLCHIAFYDQSNNNSKIWHDTAVCGTPLHMREYRKRRQAAR